MNSFPMAYTFDDILLIPQKSTHLPSEVSTAAPFARGKVLHTPIISAAMDTVTESRVARIMAQMGGLGIIHKNLSIEDQCFEVEKVKKYESGMIFDPITLGPDHTVGEAMDLMKKFSISGFPVTLHGKLVGILTNRDLRFENNRSLPIKNLMTKSNLVTCPEGTTLDQAKSILKEHRIEKLLVVNEKMDLRGLITIKDIEKAENFPQATKDSKGRLFVGAAVGVDQTSFDRAEKLIAAGADVICVDTAHGHSKNVIDQVSRIRKSFPEIIIIAGNVVTAQGTEDLILAGADVVKVGVGPGSICTTRIVAGVGMPQLSAVMTCAKAAKAKGKTIIADGGIKFSGDVTKALALGANAVMVGNLIAGTEESPGETILYHGRTYKIYRGMGSLGAMALGSKDRYSQSDVTLDKLVPEGVEGRVSHKGTLSRVLYQLTGGLKSGMGYLGASTIEELQEKAQFVQITSSGLKESHVHDVMITKEAPNYQIES